MSNAKAPGLFWTLFVYADTAECLAGWTGVACLAVELVWMRLLALSFGSASYAAGAVVAAIMLGMAIGSAWASRLTARTASTHRWLGGSLLSLACAAALSAPFLRLAGDWGTAGLVVSGLLMAVASIPMGMIIPLLVAWRETPSDTSAKRAGRLYAMNAIGSAIGVLATGFGALPGYGNNSTLLWGALFLGWPGALLLLPLPGFRSKNVTSGAALQSNTPLALREVTILMVYALSAFAAMASEIGWIRALVLSIGSSTYAYTLVLGVYIAGLGIGSALSTRLFGLTARPGFVFGAIQLAIAAACLGAFELLGWLPELFGRFLSHKVTSLGTFAWTALVAAAAALLPPTLAIGACFPVTVRWLERSTGAARASGLLLAAATAGSMLGALLGSFVAIPAAGLALTLVGALMIHALTGSTVLTFGAPGRRLWPSLAAAAILVLLVLLPRWDVRVLQSGPYVNERPGARDRRKVLFARDDHVASVAVLELPDGNRVLRIDGKNDASLSQIDQVTQLLTAHIPLSLHEKPDRVLLIGLGSGMTLASCLKHQPRVVECIEISPAVVRASRFFDDETGRPLDDPRVRLHVGDARSVVRGLREPFDVILNEPSNLWIAGMAGLFSEEFYASCRERLREGGLMGQWIHASTIPEAAFRDAIATFLKVFPSATVWEMTVASHYLLVGSTKPGVIDAEAVARRIAAPAVRDDLRRIDADAVGALLCDLVARGEDLSGFLRGARIQTDDGLHLEFAAPLGFYGRRERRAASVLPPIDPESLGAGVRGRAVGWAEARMLLRRGVQAILDGRGFSETFPPLREALQRYPEERQARLVLDDQAELCVREATQAARRGDEARAMEGFEAVPPESRWYPDARLRKVALLKKRSSTPAALAEEYRRVLGASPNHEDALAGFAECLLALGALDEAERAATRGVNVNGRSARLRLVRGRVLDAERRHDEAKSEWEEARRLDPKGPYGREAEKLLGGR